MSHADPFSIVLFEFALIILIALIGRALATRLEQPAVIGELLGGAIFGNLALLWHSELAAQIMKMPSLEGIFQGVANHTMSLEQGATLSALWLFSNLGVVLLLFLVGVETRVEEMMKVGSNALIVAIIGVVSPFLIGLACGEIFLPNSPFATHLFLAATLCATSVGITARALKDLGRMNSSEARVILGAAVIDDIMGLLILTVVAGLAQAGAVESLTLLKILGLAAGFILIVLFFGPRLAHRVIRAFSFTRDENLRLLVPLTLCFAMAFLAQQIELAAIVGAFAAGLILSDEAFAPQFKHTIHALVGPIEALFAPVFFVLMGMQINVAALFEPQTLLLTVSFTIAAIVGKLVAGLGAGRGRDKWSVGIGMIPRGEVGLIFASVGKSLGLMDESVFAAIALMVILTTLITPPLLKWSLARSQR